MMFTTELSHRVFLTVLLLLLGVVQNQRMSPGEVMGGTPPTTTIPTKSENNDKARENEEEQGHFKSILYSNSPNSYYDDYRNNEFGRRRNQPPSSVMIKANLPFTTTAQKTNNNRDYKKRNGLQPPSYANNGFFDCFFGKNCLIEDDGKDEWRNYYSVLNGLEKPVLSDRFSMQKLPFGGQSDYQTGVSAAIPFIVDSNSGKFNNRKGESDDLDRGGGKDGNSPYRRYSQYGNSPVPPHIRLSRTTTSSPNWVKLQPLPAHMYDPFPTKNKSGGVTNMSSKEGQSGSTSKFASRVGNADPEEISPETFAARYGWNKDSQQNLRLPAWLEELNQQHGFRDKGQQGGQNNGAGRPSFGGVYNENPGPASGDDRDWVKLDPIPVSGVTISKWVPKGTSPSELPSTNWPARDKPNAWWDRIDVGVGRPESPWSDGPIRSPLHSASSGWGSGSSRYPSNHNKNHHGQSHSQSQQLSDAWSDVIYPDTPVSATASWEASKKVTSGSSSFPSSWLSKGGSGGNAGNKYSGRPAVASWSANGNSGSSSNNNKISAGRFGNQNQRLPPPSSFGRPSFYPDPQAGSDDPRWVLVSTTGETSAKNPPYRVNSPPERYPDFPYEFHSHSHSNRHSKVMNFSKIIDPPSPVGILTQDELFRRTNETLNSLAPVLLHRQGLLATTDEPEPLQTFIPLLDEEDKVDIIQDKGRSGNGKVEAHRKDKSISDHSPGATPAEGGTRKTFLQGINPVLAAVGAGMIPATIAAVLPVALGRRRKRHVLVQRKAHENRFVVPRLVLTPHQHQRNLPIFLSSSAPNMYKFLRKPAMRNSQR